MLCSDVLTCSLVQVDRRSPEHIVSGKLLPTTISYRCFSDYKFRLYATVSFVFSLHIFLEGTEKLNLDTFQLCRRIFDGLSSAKTVSFTFSHVHHKREKCTVTVYLESQRFCPWSLWYIVADCILYLCLMAQCWCIWDQHTDLGGKTGACFVWILMTALRFAVSKSFVMTRWSRGELCAKCVPLQSR